MSISDKTIQLEKEVEKLKKDVEICNQQLHVQIFRLHAKLDGYKPKQKNTTILYTIVEGFFFCIGFCIGLKIFY